MRFPPNNTAITRCPDCGATVPKALAGHCPQGSARRARLYSFRDARIEAAAKLSIVAGVVGDFTVQPWQVDVVAQVLYANPVCPFCNNRHPRTVVCPQQVNWSRLSGPLPEDGSFADISRMVSQRRRGRS